MARHNAVMPDSIVRWGVAGPGDIAHRFAADLALVDTARLVAVASRSQRRAEAFADRFDVEHRHKGYESLAADPTVDVVYVATPASRHEHDVLLFLEAGKHVLCEKPFALNAAQAERMVAAARERGLFLMDAMWTRFLPSYRHLVELVGDGAIGEVLLVEADFGFVMPFDPASRLYDPAQGGGALLDLGVYPLQLASLLLGTPDRVAAVGTLAATGVDDHVAATLGHPGGGLAVAKAALRVPMACTARIAGSAGLIEIPAMMHCPTALNLATASTIQTIDLGWDGDGIRFQVEEVHRCLAAGLTESPAMPLAETVAILATMDSVRAQLGVRYPTEA